MDKAHFQHKILEAPYSRDVWKDVLRRVFSVKRLLQAPTDLQITNIEIAEKAFELGSFETTDERVIGIYEVLVKPGIKLGENRVGLRSLLKQVYKDVDGALIVFVQGNKWRFSYVSEIKVLNEETETVEDKKTEPKRYTYLFGQGEVCRTAADRFYNLIGKPIKLDDLYDAFSVDKLNKEFFKRYKEFYQRGVQYLASNSEYYDLLIDKREKEEDKKQKPIRDFVKKLMGRIVFLHFLQKKGWMGCPVLKTEDENEKNWKGGKKRFIQLLYKGYENKQQFHSRCLRTLFFETLNTKRKNNIFTIPLLVDEESSEKALTRVPYLNGGLFDRDISYDNDLDFPVEFFTQLFDFFEQYNFTIDENDPYDSEVGIDPEMLGHIFENLLEENREKGAFYTPKEIVQYMCQQSLLQYLRTHLPECREDDSPALKALENFLTAAYIEDPSDKRNFIVKNAKRIDLLLHKVKICDPAIGSGAFPMGMLQLIFKIRMALALTQDRANLKKDIIQNNIYGVDIESGAVDIARLRFWLALVVDEEEPQPLPNLDYKIMQGNSLFERFDDIDLKFEVKRFKVKLVKEVDLFGNPINPQISITEYLQSKEGINEFDLTELEEKYFNSNNAADKQEIKQKIDAFEKEFISQQIEKRKEELQTLIATKKKSVEKRKQAELIQHQQELEKLKTATKELQEMKRDNKPYFLWHLYFMDVFQEGGFDIVIGNPPYLRIQGIRKDNPMMADMLSEDYKSATGSFDLYVVFVEKGLSLLKDTGILNFIMPVKWTNAAFGEGLREIISKEKYVSKIISFEAYQVFNVSTYTGLQWFTKGSNDLWYAQLDKDVPSNDELGTFLSSLNKEKYNPISYQKLSKSPWILTDNLNANLIEKIQKHPIRVKDVFSKVYQGVATGKDNVFFLSNCALSNNGKYITGFSKGLNDVVEIEAEIVKPLLKGDQVHRYEYLKSNNYVLFPYIENASGKLKLMDLRTIKENFPNAFEYLKTFETELRNRENGRFDNDEWFQFSRNQGIAYQSIPKLLCPDISMGSNFSFDQDGKFLTTATLYGYIKNSQSQFDYEYLLAILNSKICWFFLRNTGTVLANGYFRFKPNYINPFAIPTVSDKENMIYKTLVDKVIALRAQQMETSKWENKIDALVFMSFNFSEEEMLQVLQSFPELSTKEKNGIHNEYRNIQNKHFKTEI